MAKQNNKKKLTLISLVLMMFTSVFGFYNIPRSFYLLGYGAIPWFILAAMLFFIPYAFILAEFGTAFKNEKGGIYSWMEKSVNAKYAFIGTFIWYAAFPILLVNLSTVVWIPLSNMIYGQDVTKNWSLLGLNSTQTIGLLAIIWVITITIIASRGLQKITKITSVGGSAVAVLNILLFVGAITVLILNGGKIAQPINNIQSLIQSPNVEYASPLALLSFLVFAIYAYGGIEVVGGLVDETENAQKTFPKGVIVAATAIALGYSGGIFLCGIFTNWSKVLASNDVHLQNAAYVVMQNLGYEWGNAVNFNESTSLIIGAWAARFVGLSLFLATTGAFITLSFSPLRQLIEGTPKEILPGKIGELKNNIPVNALRIQCLIIVVILALVSFAGEAAPKFFEKIVLMTNVAITFPMVFLAIVYISFKKNKDIIKPFEVFKSEKSAAAAAVIVVLTIGFANFFTIIEPIINKKDIQSALWMIAGPIFFTIAALIIYKRYEKNNKIIKKEDNVA